MKHSFEASCIELASDVSTFPAITASVEFGFDAATRIVTAKCTEPLHSPQNPPASVGLPLGEAAITTPVELPRDSTLLPHTPMNTASVKGSNTNEATCRGPGCHYPDGEPGGDEAVVAEQR